jgi:hypothetical protein
VADNIIRAELSATGTTVDVVSIPCHFHAVRYHLLDQLFIPLLSFAQEANDLLGLRVGDDKSALRAASYLAGELLRDKSFSPSRSSMSKASHVYLIDLPGNNFQAETSIFGDKGSIFRVMVKGPIRGDKFVVTDPASNGVLFSFTKFEANKPEFFVRDFPYLAQEARKDPALFSGGQGSVFNGVIDLMLGVQVGEKMVTVRVQKLADSMSVEAKMADTNKTIMNIPQSSLGNLSKLVETITQHLTENAAKFGL